MKNNIEEVFKVVSVKYTDSAMQQEQTSEILKPLVLVASGICVQESDEYITLALELVEGLDTEFRNQVSIPKGAIIQIERYDGLFDSL
jgi:hypothetical protein